jgi:hypothetical protein
VLQHANRPPPFPHDRGDLIDAELSDHAKDHHLGLVRRQRRGDEPDGPTRPEARQRFLFDVSGPSRADEMLGVDGIGSAAGPAPLQIQEPSPSDRERPRAERLLIALEPTQATGDIEPCIRRHVLGVGGRDRAYVADEARVEQTEEPREGPCLALARCDERLLEPGHGLPREASSEGGKGCSWAQKNNGDHGSGPESIASNAPTAGSSASRKPRRTASPGRRYPENIEENAPIGSGRRSCEGACSTFG